jgi:pimeloyl-ACP methyl ester carboxylesterase
MGVTAPEVVLVPGLGLGPEAYEPTVRHLDSSYRVITLPGFGVPAGRDEPLQTQALAERLLDELAEYDGARVVLVGHSASCQIVAAAAVTRPELVAGLVLVGPSGDVTASGWPTLAWRWLRSAVWEPPRLIPTLSKQYARTRFVSMARAMQVARRYDVTAILPLLAGLSVPTVVVRCVHDAIATPEWVQRVADLAGGQARTLATGAHMPVLTNGPELADTIRRAVAASGR